MPNKLIYQEEVDIYEFPTVIEKSQGGEITIGDLHGNAIKLLFILIKHGIIIDIEQKRIKPLLTFIASHSIWNPFCFTRMSVSMLNLSQETQEGPGRSCKKKSQKLY